MTCLQPHSRLQDADSKTKGEGGTRPPSASRRVCSPGLRRARGEPGPAPGPCSPPARSLREEVSAVPGTTSPRGRTPWGEASLESQWP